MHRRAFVTAALLALGAAAGAPGAALAATPEDHGRAFVALFNDGSPEAARRFAEDHAAAGSAQGYADLFTRERDEAGLLERAQVRMLPGGRSLFVTARRSKTGAWQTFQFRVDAEKGGRIQLFFIAQALEPHLDPTFGIDDPRFPAWMDKFIGRLATEQPFWGAIAIRRGGHDLYRRAFGKADAAAGRANTLETRFNTASGSKMFTAVAAMQFVEAGRLALTDPLPRLVRETAALPGADAITLRHLLSHTSGIGDYWDKAYEADWATITGHDRLLTHVLRNFGTPMPGTYEYSNSNYALLGVIVERTAGRDFYDHVHERIFRPAGMTATDYPIRNPAAWPQAVARLYDPVMDAGVVAIDRQQEVVLGARGSGAGGATTSVADMLAFDTALLGGRLVRPETLKAMTGLQAPSDIPGHGYGYGFLISDGRWGHGGSSPGCQFEFERFDASDTTYVVTSNLNTIAGPEVASLLNRVITHPGS